MTGKVLLTSVSSLYNCEQFSDVIIRCDNRTWYAHKNILCTQSEYFMKACEGKFIEAQNGCIVLKDDDPTIIEALLTYLYTGEYHTKPEQLKLRNKSLFHVQVYAAAEKFFVRSLLGLAATKFGKALTEAWDENAFAEAVVEWSSKTMDADKLLGKIITYEIVQRRVQLLKPEKDSSKFRRTLNDVSWLAADIALKLTELMLTGEPDVPAYRCPSNHSPHKVAVFHARMQGTQKFTFRCSSCNGRYSFEPTEWEKYRVDAPLLKH